MTQEDADRSICHLTAHRPQKQWSKTDSQALHRQKQRKLKCPEFQAHPKDQTCLQLSRSMLTNACGKFIASAQVQQLHIDECKTVWAEVRLVAIWSGFVSGWKWVKWSCSNISQVSLKMWHWFQRSCSNNERKQLWRKFCFRSLNMSWNCHHIPCHNHCSATRARRVCKNGFRVSK